MGVCASKPKTKDDIPIDRKVETPKNRKIVSTTGQSRVPQYDSNEDAAGPSMAYIHVETKEKRQAELDKMLMAANPADFEGNFEDDNEERVIDKIIEEENYSTYSERTNTSTNGPGLSEKEIQLRKEQISALDELERHLEDDIISTLESRSERRSHTVTPTKLKHPFLVDADQLDFPLTPCQTVESAETSQAIEPSNVATYSSPTFVQKFKNQSIESFKIYDPENEDSGNAHDEELDTDDLDSESSLTESMQVYRRLFKLNQNAV